MRASLSGGGRTVWAWLVLVTAGVASAAGAAAPPSAPPNRTIAYVQYWNHWAVYQTADGKQECPQGLSAWGPEERYWKLFGKHGAGHTVEETQIAIEGRRWNPERGADAFPFQAASGPTSYGLNLDGKVGPKDFTGPDGATGIDNELFRVIGCIHNYRGPAGAIYAVGEITFRRSTYNRLMLVLTNVDDLKNDPDVDVTISRGINDLITDATGEVVLPGGTQVLDTRWTKLMTQTLKGRIVDGVLTTVPVSVVRVPDVRRNIPVDALFYDGRFQLKLTPDYAEGVLGGYVDIDRFYFSYNREYSENVQVAGWEDPRSTYAQLTARADARPDPAHGFNTAISGAMLMKFAQTFVVPADAPRDAKTKNAAGR